MAKWRHSFYKLVPSWLSTGDGEKVLFSLGMIADAIIEHGRRSLVARFPTYVGATGLKMLGEERGILQGRGEAKAGFARRLREWRGLRGHLVRGNAYAMLRQIWQYFDGIKCQELDTGGNVYTIDVDGTESATHGGLWNWDVPTVPVATAAHDASAGSDLGHGSLENAVGAILVGPAGTNTITINYDGTPGRLVFLHVGVGATTTDGTIVTPDGWSVAGESFSPTGTGSPYYSRVYWKIIGPYETDTVVTLSCTNNKVSGNIRFIGRAVNVTGDFPADAVLEVATAADNGTSIATPALAGQAVPVLGLLFVQGRLTTYSAATGGWVELDAERTAGSTGIGIDEQSITVPTTGQASGTVTLGATSAINVIAVTVAHKTPQDWFRFWLKLVPGIDSPIKAHPTFDEVEATGKTFDDAEEADETWGQQGVTGADARVVVNLFNGARPWNAAGTKPEWLIVVLGQDEDHEPDGTWASWTYGGVPTRYPGWRYWKL
jgi:hypothetical protein